MRYFILLFFIQMFFSASAQAEWKVGDILDSLHCSDPSQNLIESINFPLSLYREHHDGARAIVCLKSDVTFDIYLFSTEFDTLTAKFKYKIEKKLDSNNPESLFTFNAHLNSGEVSRNIIQGSYYLQARPAKEFEALFYSEANTPKCWPLSEVKFIKVSKSAHGSQVELPQSTGLCIDTNTQDMNFYYLEILDYEVGDYGKTKLIIHYSKLNRSGPDFNEGLVLEYDPEKNSTQLVAKFSDYDVFSGSTSCADEVYHSARFATGTTKIILGYGFKKLKVLDYALGSSVKAAVIYTASSRHGACAGSIAPTYYRWRERMSFEYDVVEEKYRMYFLAEDNNDQPYLFTTLF